MRVLARQIDAIAVFRRGSEPEPYKFRYSEEDGTSMEIRVDKVICVDKQRIAGQNSYVYECQSVIAGTLRRYQLKYVLEDARWVLYKL